MKSPLLYLLEVLFCSGMLLAFYRLLLARKVAFGICRRYLVMAMLLSVLLPALQIPLYPARTVIYPLPLIAVPERIEVQESPVVEMLAVEQTAVIADADPSMPIDWPLLLRQVTLTLAGLTTLLLLTIFAWRVWSIRRLRRRAQLTPCGGYTLAESAEIETPFSFLRTIFLGADCTGRRREIILCHERSHIRHAHSTERLVLETLRCIFWFNPFAWMAVRWLQEVQEWEADGDVLAAGYDLTEYRTLIFHQLFGYNPDIACGLNHSLTKNRFAMMTQFKLRRFASVRLAAVVPVVAGMMLLCSFTTRTPEPPATPAAEASATALINATCPLQSHGTIGRYGGKPPVLVSTPHRGVDIPAKANTVVRAAGDGVVSSAAADQGYGNCIRITHQGGYTTLYAHLASMAVKQGDRVKGGDMIGQVGATGRATGPHLHFELAKDGQTLDPERFFDFATATIRHDYHPAVSTIHVSASGVTFNGKPISTEELAAYVAEERSKLADPSKMTLRLVADQAQPVDDTIIRTAPYQIGGDKVEMVYDDRYLTAWGNLRVTRSDDASWSVKCDSVRYDFINKAMECFGDIVYKMRNEKGAEMQYVSEYCHFQLSPQGGMGWTTRNTIGTPADGLIVKVAKDGTIRANGEVVTLDELRRKAQQVRASTTDADASVMFWCDPEAKMGVVTDVKQELRKANMLRIRYVDGDPAVRFLPPMTGAKTTIAATPNPTQKVEVEVLKVKERNLFLVLINDAGHIVAGQVGQQKLVEPAELAAMAKAFVNNPTNDPKMPEKMPMDRTLPDGRTERYPVSQGFISLQTTRNTPYAAYAEANKQLSLVYTQLRDEAAKQYFGSTSYQTSSEAVRKTIEQMIPMRISEAEPRNLAPRKK